jgi:glutamine cyclotransferase
MRGARRCNFYTTLEYEVCVVLVVESLIATVIAATTKRTSQSIYCTLQKTKVNLSFTDSRNMPPEDDHAASASTRKWSPTFRWMFVAISVAVVIGVPCVVVFSGNENTGGNPSAAAEESGTGATINTTISTGKPAVPKFTAMGTFELLETVPHDANAFTQGLELINSTHYYESTGLYGKSQVRIVDLQTGQVLDRYFMDDQYFGEGLCSYTDSESGQRRLIQLTWKKQTGFLYDSMSLQLLDSFSYNTTTSEGWGITFQPKTREFIVSDGSQYLHTWSADTSSTSTRFKETNKVAVSFQQPDMQQAETVSRLNELEWDPFQSDSVLANVWYQDSILRIDIATGFVTKMYNLQSLFPNRASGVDVLNGIAVTSVANEIWVTGKLWPSMFRIRLVD